MKPCGDGLKKTRMIQYPGVITGVAIPTVVALAFGSGPCVLRAASAASHNWIVFSGSTVSQPSLPSRN